jgi:hypothetical protein
MSYYHLSITKTTGPKPAVPKPQSTSDCGIELTDADYKQIDEHDLYVIRCKEYIKKYKWVDPDEDEDEDDGKIVLPRDVFTYLRIEFASLDSYTSDEIKQIAHYLKACELIAMLDDKYVPDGCTTYGQMLPKVEKYLWYGNYYLIVGDVRGCFCGYECLCGEGGRCYADVLMNLVDVNLDTKEIILYGELVYQSWQHGKQ